MKKLLTNCYTVFFIILFVIASCKDNNKKNQSNGGIMLTSTYYQPSKLLDSLAKIFLDSAKCMDCMNEVYIDKVNFQETYITFRAITYHKSSHNEYLVEQNPLFYFIKDEQKIFVITGAEKYIIGNQDNSKKLIFSEEIRTKVELELLIKFKIFGGSISLQKVAGMPFMPEFNQVIPDDSIPKFDPKKDYKD